MNTPLLVFGVLNFFSPVVLAGGISDEKMMRLTERLPFEKIVALNAMVRTGVALIVGGLLLP